MQTFDEFGIDWSWRPDAGGQGVRVGEQWRRRLGGRFPVKLAFFLGCLFLVAPLGLAAQNGSYGVAGMEGITTFGPDGQATTTITTVAPPNLCPVSIEASHLSDGNIVKTGADHPKGVGQRLHLKLNNPDQRMIASATVNLRGWTQKGRTEQLGQVGASDDAALGVRALTVPFTPSTDRTVSADIWVPGLTVVVSVELLSVKYSDGSTWTPPQGKTCRVAPDLLMVVTQR
jgi:hypothetical protein